MTDRQPAPDYRAAEGEPDPPDTYAYKKLEERLRHSESLLAEVEQLTSIGSFEMIIGTSTAQVSDGLHSILGVSQPGHPFDLDELYAHVHPDDRAQMRQTIEGIIAGRPPTIFVFRVIQPDGRERTIESRGKLVLDEDGRPHKIIGTAHDITERVETERALRAAREEAERANRA